MYLSIDLETITLFIAIVPMGTMKYNDLFIISTVINSSQGLLHNPYTGVEILLYLKIPDELTFLWKRFLVDLLNEIP